MAVVERLVRDPAWRVDREDGLLVVSGGADALYALTDVDQTVAEEVVAVCGRELIDPGALSEPVRDVVIELRSAGVLRAIRPEAAPSRVELRFVGRALPDVEVELARRGAHVVEGDADLVVFVRTDAELKDACGPGYESVRTPHLLLDLGFHHTISLGPLVFPGETACFGCLVGRIARYWGDARPPERPAVQNHAPLAVSLLALELERFGAGDWRLVNETVSWCLDRLETRRGRVYRLPWCPRCGDEGEQLGSIPLPWPT